MLKKQNRLGRSDALITAIRCGRVTRAPGFLLRTQKTHLPVTRFAVSISQKAEKSAVKRNRVRRQLYGILREQIHGIAPGFDCAITVQRDGCALAHKERKKTFTDLLFRARLLPHT
ncbi:MAG: ribonuclease P protein component [Patescibacteria group bacterium]|jgi:ribonuclease P protein component